MSSGDINRPLKHHHMFKKSLLAFFVAIACATAIVRAAPISQFSRPLSFPRLTRGLDKDNGVKRPRSPGLFSPPGSRLPTGHIPIGQPPADLSAISPRTSSNALVQPRDPQPEGENSFALGGIRNPFGDAVKEANGALQEGQELIKEITSKEESTVEKILRVLQASVLTKLL
jgi:hypothetical protein